MRSVRVLAVLVMLALVATFVAACAVPTAPLVESDSNQKFLGAPAAPYDTEIYTITGRVAADVDSLTRQTTPARGSMGVYNGYGSGTFVGATIDGKSYIRVYVESITPFNKSVSVEDIAIIKGTDTKLTALMPGDRVTVKCRMQYEAIAPIMQNEEFEAEKYATWELDYCRMVSPVVKVPASGLSKE